LQEVAKREKNEGAMLTGRETMQREWQDQIGGKGNSI